MAFTRALCLVSVLAIADAAGCGAWEFHQAGVAVDKVPPPAKCSANPNCPNNPGADCCPPPGANLSFNMGLLDCCNTFACECKLHPQCVHEKKTGMCCPNDKGVYDPCCSNTRAAVNNDACVKKGLKGNVCPDEKGKFDDCCHQEEACAYQNQCPGLAGNCCPTPGGVNLGCCKNHKGGNAEATELVACPNKTALDSWKNAQETRIKKHVPKEYQHYALDDVNKSYEKKLAACQAPSELELIELAEEQQQQQQQNEDGEHSLQNCNTRACVNSTCKANDASIKKYVPKEYQHYALADNKKACEKKLASLDGSTQAPAAILAALSQNEISAYGAAFFIVFVVGVAVGVGMRRTQSAGTDQYHSMS